MNDQIFTLTLIKNESASKILVALGEVPAKVDEEAAAIISKKLLPKTYDIIVSSIPNFKASEDGCEESITHSIQEFIDMYDLDLISIFEEAEEESVENADTDETTEDPEVCKDEPCETSPEFDPDIFGDKSSNSTTPGEIFLVAFKPENIDSLKQSLGL
jgi:hypothetical protein